MTEGEHTFNESGRQRQTNCTTICQWMVDAWAKVSVYRVVRVFTKAGIITEQLSNSKTSLDNDARDPDIVDAEITQLNCQIKTMKMTNLMHFWKRNELKKYCVLFYVLQLINVELL